MLATAMQVKDALSASQVQLLPAMAMMTTNGCNEKLFEDEE